MKKATQRLYQHRLADYSLTKEDQDKLSLTQVDAHSLASEICESDNVNRIDTLVVTDYIMHPQSPNLKLDTVLSAVKSLNDKPAKTMMMLQAPAPNHTDNKGLTTSDMQLRTAALTGNFSEYGDVAVSQIFRSSVRKLAQMKRVLHKTLLDSTFANLLAHTTYETLIKRCENNPALAITQFAEHGALFADTLIKHSVNTPSAAQVALAHPNYGLLSSSDKKLTLSQTRTTDLMKTTLDSMDDDEVNVWLAGMIQNEQLSTSSVLNQILNAHNDVYQPARMADIIDAIAGKLDDTTKRQLADALYARHSRQPILPALNSLLKHTTGGVKNHVDGLIDSVKQHDHEQIKQLDNPLVAYSDVKIHYVSDRGENETVELAYLTNPTQLGKLSVSGEITQVELSEKPNIVDELSKQAIDAYLFNNDPRQLAKLMSDVSYQDLPDEVFFTIRNIAPKINNTKYLDSLFNNFSDNPNAGIRHNNQLILSFKDMKTSHDVFSAVNGKTDITVDDANMGQAFQEELVQAVDKLTKSDETKAHNTINNLIMASPNSYTKEPVLEQGKTLVDKIQSHSQTLVDRIRPK